jgi:sn-glycerol 3-phosphate transport system permease protein
MQRRVVFDNPLLPYLLLAPQLLIVGVFFFLPAGQAILYSLMRQDPFGLRMEFVWFANFKEVLTDPFYLNAVYVTVVFSVAVIAIAMSVGLLLAVVAESGVRGASIYRTLIMWPYALAPAVAASLWLFIFHPTIGVLGRVLTGWGVPWDFTLDGTDAMLLIITASAWKRIGYNFIFFLAGLQAIPRELLDAASVDGAGAWQRFRKVIFPLLSPTTFFLLVVNVIFAFFETFGVVHSLTRGGPGKATETLIYKVYLDGVVNLDLGGSSAQSVILMLVVIMLTAVQFKYIERRVHY